MLNEEKLWFLKKVDADDDSAKKNHLYLNTDYNKEYMLLEVCVII